MKIYIDGHRTHVAMSRLGSMWYEHPVRKTSCMRIKRNFALGYQTKQGLVSRSNEIQKQFSLFRPVLDYHSKLLLQHID